MQSAGEPAEENAASTCCSESKSAEHSSNNTPFVKVGSVVAEGCLNKLAIDLPESDENSLPFLFHKISNSGLHDQVELVISSTGTYFNVKSELENGKYKRKTVGTGIAQSRLFGPGMQDLHVQWGCWLPIAVLSDEILKPWMIDGTSLLDYRKIEDCLRVLLYHRDKDFYSNIVRTSHCFNQRIKTSMASMYAKLWTNYFLQLRAEVDTNMVLAPLPDSYNDAPTFIDFDTETSISAARKVDSCAFVGGILLIDGKTYMSSDLDMWCYLATDTPIYYPVENSYCIPAQCYRWPSINVAVCIHSKLRTSHDDISTNTILPKPIRIDAKVQKSFIITLAALRDEDKFLVEGFYMAIDILNSDWLIYKNDPLTFGPCNPYFEVNSTLHLPKPFDGLAIIKFLTEPEVFHFLPTPYDLDICSYESKDILKTAAICGAIVSAMTTTVFSSFNINGNELSNSHVPGQVRSIPNATWVFDSVSQIIPGPFEHFSVENQQTIFRLVRALLQHCFEASLPATYIGHRCWSGNRVGGVNNRIPSWNELTFSPPRRGSNLAVDNWLILRPLEWGITTPHFRSVSSFYTQPDGTFYWSACRESNEYSSYPYPEYISQLRPVKLLVSGLFALNAI